MPTGKRRFNDTLTRLKAENPKLVGARPGKPEADRAFTGNIELMQKINNQKIERGPMRRCIGLRYKEAKATGFSRELWDKQLSRALAGGGRVQKEREQLLQAHDGLERDFTKIKDMNTYLLEKEKLLQYALTKERAQSLGLERICQDFKVQIDEMAKSGVTNW